MGVIIGTKFFSTEIARKGGFIEKYGFCTPKCAKTDLVDLVDLVGKVRKVWFFEKYGFCQSSMLTAETVLFNKLCLSLKLRDS
jgi:hypothetical protein